MELAGGLTQIHKFHKFHKFYKSNTKVLAERSMKKSQMQHSLRSNIIGFSWEVLQKSILDGEIFKDLSTKTFVFAS